MTRFILVKKYCARMHQAGERAHDGALGRRSGQRAASAFRAVFKV
jgi:hypothetical protein